MKRIGCALLVLALCIALSACGNEEYLIEKSEDYYINDVADALAYETRAVVYYNSKALDDACGAQIVVVTTRTLGNEDIEDFAYKLFNQWGVGDSKKNNGILLLMKPANALADKNYFVATGTGAVDIIGDAELKLLLDDYLYDDFVAGNYDRGTLKIYQALFEKVRDYYNVNLAYQDETSLIRTGKLISENEPAAEAAAQTDSFAGGRTNKTESREGGISLGWIIFIVIVAVIIIAALRRKRRSNAGAARVTPIIVNTPPVRQTPPPRPVVTPPPAARPYVYKSAPNTARTYRSAATRSSILGSILGNAAASRPSISRSSSARTVTRPSASSATRSTTSRASVSRSSTSRPSSFGGGRSGGGRTSGGGAGMRR